MRGFRVNVWGLEGREWFMCVGLMQYGLLSFFLSLSPTLLPCLSPFSLMQAHARIFSLTHARARRHGETETFVGAEDGHDAFARGAVSSLDPAHLSCRFGVRVSGFGVRGSGFGRHQSMRG